MDTLVRAVALGAVAYILYFVFAGTTPELLRAVQIVYYTGATLDALRLQHPNHGH